MKKPIMSALFITLFFVCLSGVFYAFYKGDKENPLANTLEGAVLPVQNAFLRVINNIKNSDVYIEENRVLKNENGKLKYEIRKYEGLKQENIRLRSLLELSQNNKEFQMVACDVIGKSNGNSGFMLKINKGKNHGIQNNDTAVLNYSLVGKVCDLGENWAKISLIISPESSVGAVACQSKVTAIVEGNAALAKKGKVALLYISEKDKLITGEQIETSGEMSYYPKGLLIGTVAETTENGAVLDTNIDFNSISEVMIIKRGQD